MATIDRTTVGALNGVTSTSKDFFFSSSGTNSASVNTGTVTVPWLDLRNLNNTTNQLDSIEAGDRFLFKTGETCRHLSNFLTGTITGTAVAPIIVGVYENGAYTETPTQKAIIIRNGYTDRNSSFIASSAYTNTPVYYMSVTAWAAGEGALWEDGDILYQSDNVTKLLESADGGTYDGTYNVYAGTLHATDGGGSGVYWRPTSGTTKSSETVWLADGNWGGNTFSFSNAGDVCEYIIIENIEFKQSGCPIYFSNTTTEFSNITIRNNIHHDSRDYMCYIQSPSTGGPSDTIKIYNNIIYNVPQGISLHSSNQSYLHSNHEIYNNTIYNVNYLNSDYNRKQATVGGSIDSEGIGIQNPQSCKIYKNEIYNVGAPEQTPTLGNTAISLWNNNAEAAVPHNNEIYSNYIYDVEFGITGIHNSYYTVDSTNNKVYNNILINCTSIGAKVIGQGDTNYFVNNILADCDVGIGIFYAGGSTGDCQVKNNIILNPKTRYIGQNHGSIMQQDVDYNIYYGSPDDSVAFAISIGTSHPYTGTGGTFTAWRALTNTPDLNSEITDPEITVDPPTSIDDCIPTSSNVMNGSTLTWNPTQDYFKNWYVGNKHPIGPIGYTETKSFIPATIIDNFQDTEDSSWAVTAYSGGDETVEFLTATQFLYETGFTVPGNKANVLKITVPSVDSLFRITKTMTSEDFTSIGSSGPVGVWAFVTEDSIDNWHFAPKCRITNDSLATEVQIQIPVSAPNQWLFLGGYREYATVDTINDANLATIDTLHLETSTLNLTSNPSIFYLANLEIGGSISPPSIIIEQDDGNEETDYFFEQMSNRGLVGQLNVISTNVDSGSNTSTTSVINSAINAGHSICLHGGPDLTQLSIEAAAANVQTEIDFFANKGWIDGIEHYAYPLGEFNNDIINMIIGKGFKTARGVASTLAQSRNMLFANYEYPQMYFLRSMGGWSGATVAADMQAVVDDAIKTRSTGFCLFHSFGVAGTPPKAEFETFLDYVEQKVSEKQIQVITRPTWFSRCYDMLYSDKDSTDRRSDSNYYFYRGLNTPYVEPYPYIESYLLETTTNEVIRETNTNIPILETL